MGTFVVIGESARVAGFGLGGATVIDATSPDEVHRAWDGLGADATVVVLTPEAASSLGEAIERHDHVLSVVMPS